MRTIAATPSAAPIAPRADTSPPASPIRKPATAMTPATRASAPRKAPALATVLLLRAHAQVQVEGDEERQGAHDQEGQRRAQRVVLRLQEQPLDDVPDVVHAAAAEDERDHVLA